MMLVRWLLFHLHPYHQISLLSGPVTHPLRSGGGPCVVTLSSLALTSIQGSSSNTFKVDRESIELGRLSAQACIRRVHPLCINHKELSRRDTTFISLHLTLSFVLMSWWTTCFAVWNILSNTRRRPSLFVSPKRILTFRLRRVKNNRYITEIL